MEIEKLSEVEKAKMLIQKEKQERAEAFSIELKQLCEEYNCSLHVGDIMIQAN
jgi:hypothetical protein